MTEIRLNTGLTQPALLAGIVSDTFNDADQTADGTLATTIPLRLRDGTFEIIDVDAIDENSLIGLPLLDSHRRESIDDVHGIVIGARHEPGRLIITMHIDNAATAKRVKAGVLRSLSIGYQRLSIISESIDPKTKIKTRVVRVKPVEASLVAIPADPGATVRQQENPQCLNPTPQPRRKTTPPTTRPLNSLPSSSASRRALTMLASPDTLPAAAPLSGPLTAIKAEALAVWAPPPKIRLADWIESTVTLPSDVSATPGTMKLFSYQRGICDAVDDPAISRITFVKPVRIGATALIVAIVGAYVQNDPCNILALQPTLDDARDFVVSTIEPTFAASPKLAGLLTREKTKRDTILSRRFPGGSFKCVAAASPRNLRRHTVRILVMDEVDAYEPSAEGSPIKLAEKRTLSFPNRLIFQASTPTTVETSNILKAYSESDQRIFEIPCAHCGEFFEPRWKDVVWGKDSDGNHLPETAHMVCPTSGCVIEESSKPAAVEAGRWRATKPHVVGHAGFKTSALVSTLTNASWAEIAKEFLAAKADPDLLRVVTNTLFAEPWLDRAGDGLDEGTLQARAEPCGLEALPVDIRVLVAGIDLQDDRCEVVTCGFSATEMFVLAYETVHGPPTSDETWARLDDLLKRRFQHPLGGQLSYDAAALDSGSGSHTDLAYAFTRPRFARGVVSIKGDGGTRPLIERSSKPGLYIVGVDGAKSRLFGLLEKPGHIRFSADLPARFYEELCSERRVTFYKAGQPLRRWERIKGMRNEALDATCYAMAVRQLVGVDFLRRENELRQVITAPAVKSVFKSKWMEGGRE
ncbi:MAG TPA: terminase gpA endonuclease subunit [Hyphomonadaceae bacterium]|jgi:phage terminase large subunit GpA-like protein|nr:terminase gpA endonuclease subunit [Hyphomonadaceae bacterium]